MHSAILLEAVGNLMGHMKDGENIILTDVSISNLSFTTYILKIFLLFIFYFIINNNKKLPYVYPFDRLVSYIFACYLFLFCILENNRL